MYTTEHVSSHISNCVKQISADGAGARLISGAAWLSDRGLAVTRTSHVPFENSSIPGAAPVMLGLLFADLLSRTSGPDIVRSCPVCNEPPSCAVRSRATCVPGAAKDICISSQDPV